MTRGYDFVARARAGEPDWLKLLRDGWVGELAQPRTFEVHSQKAIFAPLMSAAALRREVFGHIKRFGPWQPRRAELETTRRAVADILRCPPLAQRFAQCALAHMGGLEARLDTDDTLSRSKQRAMRQQLLDLAAPGRNCWENWIWQTPKIHHGQFDEIIEAWLAEPLDPADEVGVSKELQAGPRSLKAAHGFFEAQAKFTRHFLGVELLEGDLGDINMPCAFLTSTVEDANRWAEMAGLRLRFEHRAATAPAGPDLAQAIERAKLEVKDNPDDFFARMRALIARNPHWADRSQTET